MIQAFFKSCSLEMLLEMLEVSNSKLTTDISNKADAQVMEENYNIVKLLEKEIVARRAADPSLK
ncbi:MAG: hypothetical protein ACXWV8_14605 [Chitinophagaceae bacterium]